MWATKKIWNTFYALSSCSWNVLPTMATSSTYTRLASKVSPCRTDSYQLLKHCWNTAVARGHNYELLNPLPSRKYCPLLVVGVQGNLPVATPQT
jgi:hypothetical protein